MKTVIKVIAALAGLLLLAFIGVGLYAQFIFNPNDYKQQITAWVEQHTGRELTIQGRIKLSFFPWLAVDIGRVSLGNRKGFAAKPFARVSGVTVSLRLIPMLLNRQIKTKALNMEGLTLNLAVDKSGRANWGDLMSLKEVAGNSGNVNKEGSTRKVGEGVERYLSGLAVGGVHVGHAAINWDDEAEGRHIRVNDLNLDSGAILPRRPFPLKLRFDVQAQPAAIRSHVSIHGTGLVEPLKGDYRISDFHIDTDTSGKRVPASPLAAKLRGKLLFDLKAQRLLISDMVAQAFGATVTGSLQGIQLLGAPAFTGKLEFKGVDLRSMMNLATSKPIITRDSDVLGNATGKINFDANSHQVSVSYLHAQFDASIVNGVFTVRDFDQPFTRFELFVDQIDLDRYLPPSAGDAAATPGAAATAGVARIPVKTLRALGLDGKLQVGQLKVDRLRMRHARLAIQADKGRITVRPAASLYGGQYQGNIHVDARGAQPRLAFDESVEGIRLGPLLQDAMDSDVVSGKADLHAKFSLVADPARLARSLAGSTRFKLSDGTIRGVDLARLIRQARAGLEGRSLKGAADARQTGFTELSGTLNADNGVVQNRDLTAKTPFLRLAGRGKVNLVTKAVDYRLDARIVDSPAGQGGQDLRALKGLTIPIHVGGSISRLTFAPDLGGLVKKELGGRLQKELQRQLKGQDSGAAGKRLEELKDRLQKNLNKLFQH
ncbi:MAG TPA: AsmA family protein [Gammaproteobacteria bacterium]|nr:AsmA family protein [Gammaproteobacteria bacterium]